MWKVVFLIPEIVFLAQPRREESFKCEKYSTLTSYVHVHSNDSYDRVQMYRMMLCYLKNTGAHRPLDWKVRLPQECLWCSFPFWDWGPVYPSWDLALFLLFDPKMIHQPRWLVWFMALATRASELDFRSQSSIIEQYVYSSNLLHLKP